FGDGQRQSVRRPNLRRGASELPKSLAAKCPLHQSRENLGGGGHLVVGGSRATPSKEHSFTVHALKNARLHLIVRQSRPQIPRKSPKKLLGGGEAWHVIHCAFRCGGKANGPLEFASRRSRLAAPPNAITNKRVRGKSTPLARCGSAGYDSFDVLAERWPRHGLAIETTGLFACPRSAARVRARLAAGRARRVGPRFAQPAARRAVSRPRPLAQDSALDPAAG